MASVAIAIPPMTTMNAIGEDERRSALALASRNTTRHGDRTTRVSERGWLFGIVTVSTMGDHGGRRRRAADRLGS